MIETPGEIVHTRPSTPNCPRHVTTTEVTTVDVTVRETAITGDSVCILSLINDAEFKVLRPTKCTRVNVSCVFERSTLTCVTILLVSELRGRAPIGVST